ncbi:MAG: hypothetical protein FH753_02560 [Firmicutes bacterium]|nr:hypothetical protein [Bacillota bacterium]MTI71411.1 hypothetical protein [Bacillota bacterium]
MLYPIPWYIALIQTIPETFLIIQIGFRLFNIDIKIKENIYISFIVAIAAYFIRKYIEIFGLHTIIQILLIIILVCILTKLNFFISSIGIFMGTLLTGIIQNITIPLLLDILSFTTNDLAIKPWLNVLFYLPTGIITLIIYIILRRVRFYIIDLKPEDRVDNIV